MLGDLIHNPNRLNTLTETIKKRHKIDLSEHNDKKLKSLLETLNKQQATIVESNHFGEHLKNPTYVRNSLLIEAIILRLQTNGETTMNKNKNKIHAMISESSEIAKAELVLAGRGVVDDLQKMIEKLSSIQIEDLSAILDRIKIEHGIEVARSFGSEANGQIAASIEVLKSTKDQVENQFLILSGEVDVNQMAQFKAPEETAPDVVEPEEQDDNFDGSDAAAGPKDEPLGRARKDESKRSKSFKIVESKHFRAEFLADYGSADQAKLNNVFDTIDRLVSKNDLLTFKDLKNVIPAEVAANVDLYNTVKEYFVSSYDDMNVASYDKEDAMELVYEEAIDKVGVYVAQLQELVRKHVKAGKNPVECAKKLLDKNREAISKNVNFDVVARDLMRSINDMVAKDVFESKKKYQKAPTQSKR